MANNKQLAVRIDGLVIALLKQLARERGISQAKLIRELILKEVYK
jgi:predicted HicB family RNase H-like nuclease